MDRRDFLFLRTKPKSRELELSCESIYLKCLDPQVTGEQAAQGHWPVVFDARTTRELFDDLHEQLLDVDTVRVTKMQWLTGDLRREFGNLLRAFRARGGRIEIVGQGK